MTAREDEPEIIDVEAEEIEEDRNLPAVVETPVRTYQHSEPITKWSEEWWKRASPEVQANRCIAHKKNGDRCRNAAILGATVCRFHGGAAKHVKRAARARLENAADLMAKQLLGIALTAESESVKLAAIKDALDRSGLKPPSEVVLSQGEPKPYETVFDSIGGDADAAGFDSGPWLDDGSAGHHMPPAPAYDPCGDTVQAEAGEGVRPHFVPADEHRGPSGDPLPPRQGGTRGSDRQGPRERSERHITGAAAILLANEANRQIGALPPLPELESPHKRYRRP